MFYIVAKIESVRPFVEMNKEIASSQVKGHQSYKDGAYAIIKIKDLENPSDFFEVLLIASSFGYFKETFGEVLEREFDHIIYDRYLLNHVFWNRFDSVFETRDFYINELVEKNVRVVMAKDDKDFYYTKSMILNDIVPLKEDQLEELKIIFYEVMWQVLWHYISSYKEAILYLGKILQRKIKESFSK